MRAPRGAEMIRKLRKQILQNGFYLFIFVVVIIHLHMGREDEFAEENNIHLPLIKETNVFAFSLCKNMDALNNMNASYKILFSYNPMRQIEQALVLLKSAVALTSETLKFIVYTEEPGLYTLLEEKVLDEFPDSHLEKLTLENIELHYPKKLQKMKRMFRPCATARIFVPGMSPYDSVVYVDTDMIFLRPPEDLWKEFDKFGEENMFGLSPTLYMYNFKKDKIPFPYYGETGLNAGVIMLNVTRINTIYTSFLSSMHRILIKYNGSLTAAEQDMLNVFFSENPQYLYEMGCDWNFSSGNCQKISAPCTSGVKNGISILHGLAFAFFHGKNTPFKTVFNAWKNYKLGTPIKNFTAALEKDLLNIRKAKLPNSCIRVKPLNDMLTKRLKNMASD